MKRKVLSALLAATMVGGLLAGCGNSSTSSSVKSSTGSSSTGTSASSAADDSVTKTDLGGYTEENPYHLVFSYIEFYQQDDAARTAVQDALNEYMIPKYHMEVEFLPLQYSEYTQKIQLMISGGDLEVNETKLVNFLGEQVHAAVITEECGLNAGYIGPVNLKVNGDAVVLYDKSLEGRNNLSCGANEAEHHYKGLDMERDVPNAEYHDFAKIQEGGICPKCGKKTVKISRGIEVGNIFQLGTKYTKSMNMTYVDANGESQTPIMGCYGIGVGRLAASVCEAHHDEYGPIWPKAIAPWQVHLCAVRVDDEEVRAYADKLYEDLQNAGIEVIYDDRSVRAGVMFADADLLGIPLRIIVSPKNMKQGVVEVASRDKTLKTQIPLENVMEEIKQYL